MSFFKKIFGDVELNANSKEPPLVASPLAEDIQSEGVSYAETVVYFNGDFYFIESLVDYFSMPDRDGKNCYLSPKTSNQELGEAVLKGLNGFRVLPSSEYEMYDEGGLTFVDDKNKSQIKKYSYKNKTALLHNMIEVLVSLANENIDFKPFRKLALQAGEAITDDDYNVIVRIPSNSTPEEVGKAARLALSRCENPLGEKKGLPKHNFDAFLK